MKRLSLSIGLFLFLMFATLVSAQESLADKARALKGQQRSVPTKRVITNDTLGVDSRPAPAAATTSTSATGTPAADAKDAKKDEAAATLSPEDLKKLADEWRGKIEKQKADIAMMERELTVSQRENKLRAASFYADAGTRLRDEAKYAESDRQYQAEAAGKQKALADAKANLDKMRDEARKAGVPAGQIP
jgi:hypothetical protein